MGKTPMGLMAKMAMLLTGKMPVRLMGGMPMLRTHGATNARHDEPRLLGWTRTYVRMRLQRFSRRWKI